MSNNRKYDIQQTVQNSFRFLLWISGFFLILNIQSSYADSSTWDQNDHVGVRILSAVNATGDLEKIPLALEFTIKKNWKIYWRNPGDAGYPPQPDWVDSENVKKSDIIWPRPERFSVLGLQSLGYKNHVVLPLNITPETIGNAIRLKGSVNYLTCEDICIPYTAELDLTIPAGEAHASQHAQIINQYLSQAPLKVKLGEENLAGLNLIDTGFQQTDNGFTLKLAVQSVSKLPEIDAIIEGPMGSYFDTPITSITDNGNAAEITITGGGITEEQRANHPLTVTLWSEEKSIETTVVFKSGISHLNGGETGNATSITHIILIALLGGLILNLMPCVLPVLSLKVLSIMDHGDSSHTKIRLSFLATTLGILSAFLALAIAMILFKQAGYTIGWGIQFQQPIFLIFMVFVVTGFAANLLGFFEIHLPDAITNTAATTGQFSSGLKGHFLTGIFATLLATPCSAPFLGTAVGFALSQGPLEILFVFLALGFGLAAPYMIFMLFPSLAQKLPRPGPWMVWVKYILAIALLATAIWLTTVLFSSLGILLSWAGLGLALGMIVLLYLRKRIFKASLLPILALPLMIALTLPFFPETLKERYTTSNTGQEETINWQGFEQAKIQSLVQSGKSVFVDVTADWCITCQFNKNTVLSDIQISSWMNSDGVIPMKADWTLPSDEIAAYLAQYGRYGIPFNILYSPAHPKGIILPELLTVNTVLAAIAETK